MSTNSSSAPGSATAPATHLSLDNTLGALLVGALFSVFLFGATCVQSLFYFTRYPRDRPPLKFLVASLFTLDLFDAIITSHLVYFYLVSNYMNPDSMERPAWSIKLHVLVTSLSDLIVRCCFARRVWRLSMRNFWLTGCILVLSALDFIVGLIITIRAFQIPTYAGLEAISDLFYLNFAAGTLADLFVALPLCCFLWRSRTGFGRTDSLLLTLIVYTVNTGLITAIDASAGLVTYAVMPGNMIYIAFYLNLSKLYVNSYLASLNARKGLLHASKYSRSSRNGDSNTKSVAARERVGMISIHPSRVSVNMPSFRKLRGGFGGGDTMITGTNISFGDEYYSKGSEANGDADMDGYGFGEGERSGVGTGTGTESSDADVDAELRQYALEYRYPQYGYDKGYGGDTKTKRPGFGIGDGDGEKDRDVVKADSEDQLKDLPVPLDFGGAYLEPGDSIPKTSRERERDRGGVWKGPPPPSSRRSNSKSQQSTSNPIHPPSIPIAAIAMSPFVPQVISQPPTSSHPTSRDSPSPQSGHTPASSLGSTTPKRRPSQIKRVPVPSPSPVIFADPENTSQSIQPIRETEDGYKGRDRDTQVHNVLVYEATRRETVDDDSSGNNYLDGWPTARYRDPDQESQRVSTDTSDAAGSSQGQAI